MKYNEYFKGWSEVIDKSILNKEVNFINAVVSTGHKICPEYNNIFRAFNLCPYEDLKVVMVGQDPYPQKGVATGILFGNSKDTTEDNLSPSLKVIKKSVFNLENPNIGLTFDNTMESWAKQGILMINSAFTCEVNKVGSHMMAWRLFVSSLLESISSKKDKLVFVLFGNVAQTFENHIDGDNIIIKVEHPAYFARTHKEMPSLIFTSINDILKSYNKTPIEWYKKIN